MAVRSVARRALPGLEARLQARNLGHVQFTVDSPVAPDRDASEDNWTAAYKGTTQAQHAGVYLLQDEGRKLVHGRAVY